MGKKENSRYPQRVERHLENKFPIKIRQIAGTSIIIIIFQRWRRFIALVLQVDISLVLIINFVFQKNGQYDKHNSRTIINSARV